MTTRDGEILEKILTTSSLEMGVQVSEGTKVFNLIFANVVMSQNLVCPTSGTTRPRHLRDSVYAKPLQ